MKKLAVILLTIPIFFWAFETAQADGGCSIKGGGIEDANTVQPGQPDGAFSGSINGFDLTGNWTHVSLRDPKFTLMVNVIDSVECDTIPVGVFENAQCLVNTIEVYGEGTIKAAKGDAAQWPNPVNVLLAIYPFTETDNYYYLRIEDPSDGTVLFEEDASLIVGGRVQFSCDNSGGAGD